MFKGYIPTKGKKPLEEYKDRTKFYTYQYIRKSNSDYGGIFKVKNHQKNPEKFADTPERCFIINEDVNNLEIPKKLDRDWYIKLAVKRLKDFGVSL